MICTMFNNDAVGAPSAPREILENLAARFRQAGACLFHFGPDGSLSWHDAEAAPLFLQYVLPMLRDEAQPVRQWIAGMGADSPIAVSDAIPGILLAASPWVEKRRLRGTLALAAVGRNFQLVEEVQRHCSRLELDAIWLHQQASRQPAADEEEMLARGSILLDMLRDQLRLAGLEGELDSLSTQLAATYEELTLIYQVSSGMKINRDAADFFKQTCKDVMDVMGVRAIGVALTGARAGRFPPTLYGEINLPPEALRRLAEQLSRRMARNSEPLLVNDLRENGEFGWLGEFANHLLAVPLQRQDEHLGCVLALDKRQWDFDSTDAKLLLSIANESAIYVENSRLFADVHGLMMGLLHSLTSAVDAKDAYTCGHSERVALVSRELAIVAGLDQQQAERIYMAGLLHDVGKIGVPEAVLRKTGKLTDEEFAEIKKHPAMGARILQDVEQIADLLPGVLHHHERYDGRGYPAGLSGTNIPLMGRIICLADCFDAMTSSRTYRAALPLEAALVEIRRCAGTQFDPLLAEAFLRIPMDRLRGMLKEYHDQSRLLLETPARPAA